MATGQQIREKMIDLAQGALGFRGTTTALASSTDHITDAIQFKMAGLSTQEHGGNFIRITSTSNSDAGYVGLVQYLDVTTGKAYIDPAAGAAIVSGATYEFWRGIRPDSVDKGRDIFLETMGSAWRTKPLSILADVAAWSTAAYSSSAGGVQDATGAVTTLAFPEEIFASGMLVTNTGATGYIASPSFYVQPTQQYRVFARVSVRAQTATVRVRDITNGADITGSYVTDTSSFTLRGWRWVELTFTVPTDCGEVQVWLGGASASCIALWAGLGVLPVDETEIVHDTRAISAHDIGFYYAYSLPSGVRGGRRRSKITDVRREYGGDNVLAVFDEPPGRWPVYYMERHRYTALQSTYTSLAQREVGDAATTDCNVDYAAWGTMVALLEPNSEILTPPLARLLQTAKRELRQWDRRVGADPLIAPEFTEQGSVYLAAL